MTTEDLQVTGAPARAPTAVPRAARSAARAAVADQRRAAVMEQRRPAVIDASRLPYVLSALAAVAATVAAAGSFLFPSLLTGAAVATGNMRGTALAVLLVGLPVLVTAMVHSARGSARALVIWLGTLAYLLYQAVLFCFAVPLNNLFLAYVAYLGLCLWSLVTVLLRSSLDAFGRRLSVRMPPASGRGGGGPGRRQRLRLVGADRPRDLRQPAAVPAEGHGAAEPTRCSSRTWRSGSPSWPPPRWRRGTADRGGCWSSVRC